jgi:RNA polymerase sigma factor (sigma-70 family)
VSVSIITSQAIPAPSAGEAEMGLRLANGVSGGDMAAETELVRFYERGVLMILTRVTGDPELARDLCQDTFVIVLKRLRASPLEEPARLAAFIAQTARNLAIAEKRRDSRRRTDPDSEVVNATADDAPSREQVSEAESAASAVRRLLQGLKSTRDRAAIVRYYLDEESKEKICTDLGLTELQFNLVLFRARDRLRQILRQSGFAKSDLLSLVIL